MYSRTSAYVSATRPSGDSPSYSDSPRVMRGVHRRDQRSKGQTPAERAAANEAINSILQTLNGKSFDDLGSLQLNFPPLSSQPRHGDTRDPTGLRPWSQTVRRRADREEDDNYAEELDEMKEEVTAISTDLELLDWARRRVFSSAPPSPSTASATTFSDGMESMTFPKTYPRIIGHIMRVARQSFNNPHLALSFFHYAQTSSPESYLTGCLASAYNELIKTRWECFRDLDGVDQAIREMDANAVSWDLRTQRVVGRIVEEVGKEVIQQGTGAWGEGVYVTLDRLEKKVQRAIRQTEYLHEKARTAERERRLWSGSSSTSPHYRSRSSPSTDYSYT